MACIYPLPRPPLTTPPASTWKTSSTQPYDKITPAMQERYYQASPYNLIRVILWQSTSPTTPSRKTSTPARPASGRKEWRKEHILAEESEPALYGYSPETTTPSPMADEDCGERRGFIARLRSPPTTTPTRSSTATNRTFPKHKVDSTRLSP